MDEPHEKAHGTIRDYFSRLQQDDRLKQLRSEDVLQISAPLHEAERFDVVDAEGFIYTILPTRSWLEKCAALTRTGGFFVVFYYEAYRSFMELVLKVVHARYRALTGLVPQVTAEYRLMEFQYLFLRLEQPYF